MTASTSNYLPVTSKLVHQEKDIFLEDAKSRLSRTEFLIKPLAAYPSEGIPYGFYTVGLSRQGLPEFYVSGVLINSGIFRVVYSGLKLFVEWLAENNHDETTAQEICRLFNDNFSDPESRQYFEARPIDVERLVYGPAQLLRYWLDREGYRNTAQAIQIVWREDVTYSFPVHSSEQQLLIDYVPFGTKVPEPPRVGAFNAIT